MIGLEFASGEITTKIKEYAYSKQVLVLPCGAYGNIIRLAPDLTMSEADIQKGLDIITEAIHSFHK
jgi:4-aminobutyrate aminotransferase-like enzyme